MAPGHRFSGNGPSDLTREWRSLSSGFAELVSFAINWA